MATGSPCRGVSVVQSRSVRDENKSRLGEASVQAEVAGVVRHDELDVEHGDGADGLGRGGDARGRRTTAKEKPSKADAVNYNKVQLGSSSIA